MALRVFIVVIYLLLVIPLSYQLLFFSSKEKLGGVENKSKFPLLSYNTITNGSFQREFDNWLSKNLLFRSVLIKTDNQINVSIFNQFSSSISGKAIIGKDRQFIEKAYIKRAQGALAPKKEKLIEKLQEVINFKNSLEKRGIKLFIFISANKPATYPDIIPERFKVDRGAIADYKPAQFLAEYLESNGIAVINIPEYFKTVEKDKHSYLFAKSGTHWSTYGSCLALVKLLEKIKEQDKSFNAKFNCKIDGYNNKPQKIDQDLLSLANIWFQDSLLEKAPQVSFTAKKGGDFQKSRVLFVGTSFLWSIFYHLDQADLFSVRDMYYYFRRSFSYPSNEIKKISRDDDIWLGRALEARYIILEVNEAFPHRLGYKFHIKMLKYSEN